MVDIFDKIEILFSEVMSGTRAHNTTKMSTEMPTTTNVIDMPVEQVTQAIVAAAKRVRKPKAEITIVEQIVSDILAGNFAEEAAAHLKQIFGDEFCIKRGLMEKPKKTRKPKAQKVVIEEPVVSGAIVSEGEEKPKKVRKQKTPKIVSEEPGVSEEKPKEKKVRKPKAPKVVVEPISEAVVSEAVVSEEKPKEKKVRKPKAPKVLSEAFEAVEAPVAEEKPKVKKVRKPTSPKETTTVEAPVSEATVSEAVEVPVTEEKPKVKKVTKKPTSPKETTSEAPVTEEKPKEKKVRKPKSPKETPAAAVVESPVLETDEFSENWGKPLEDELVEEELSDIEEEE